MLVIYNLAKKSLMFLRENANNLLFSDQFSFISFIDTIKINFTFKSTVIFLEPNFTKVCEFYKLVLAFTGIFLHS